MSALGYYLLAYTVMTLLAFGVAATLGRAGEGDIAGYRGLGRRAPGLAAAMALALISLVGIPPTIGFFGKLRLFSLAVQGGHTVLAIIGVLSSVASAYYYLRVIVLMYMTEAEGEPSRTPAASRAGAVALGLGAVAIFALAFVAGL
jgi:NADH-quinone oxidoreductase subunit N